MTLPPALDLFRVNNASRAEQFSMHPSKAPPVMLTSVNVQALAAALGTDIDRMAQLPPALTYSVLRSAANRKMFIKMLIDTNLESLSCKVQVRFADNCC